MQTNGLLHHAAWCWLWPYEASNTEKSEQTVTINNNLRVMGRCYVIAGN